MSRFLIYALCEPETGFPRYIGKSESGLTRPNNHLRPCVYENLDFPVYRWIRKRLQNGQTPLVKIIETFDSPDSLGEHEQELICYFRSLGCHLLNMTDGGDGASGRKLSDETKRKISEANKRWQTPEKRAQIAKSVKEYHQKTGCTSSKAAAKSLWNSPESVERWKKSQAARYARPEERQKLSAAQKLRMADPKVRQQMSEARRGKPNPKKCKQVVDDTGHVFPSIKAAAACYGVRPSAISAVLSGQRSHCKGHHFSYLNPTEYKESA